MTELIKLIKKFIINAINFNYMYNKLFTMQSKTIKSANTQEKNYISTMENQLNDNSTYFS